MTRGALSCRRPAALICTLSLVSGCGSHGTPEESATQVVARVNGRELTVSQLNRALIETHASDTNPAATQLALNRLIDQELMVQAAEKAKLDQEPDVVLRVNAV